MPPKFGKEFATLEQTLAIAADRDDRKKSTMDNVSAAVWRHHNHKARNAEVKQEKTTLGQFVLAAPGKPRRFQGEVT